jgi:hypothetical protein
VLQRERRTSDVTWETGRDDFQQPTSPPRAGDKPPSAKKKNAKWNLLYEKENMKKKKIRRKAMLDIYIQNQPRLQAEQGLCRLRVKPIPIPCDRVASDGEN